VRAHDASTLRTALHAGTASFDCGLVDAHVPLLPVLNIMHAALGIRPALAERFLAALGPVQKRLELLP
jgi:hypothetical protein